MKRHLLTIFILQLVAINVFAQVTLTLQPDPAAGKDAEIFSCVPCGYADLNFGNQRDLNSVAWTNNLNTSNIRSLIQFDLTSIPAGSTITNAVLSLYYNADNKEGQHVTSFLHKNTTLLQRVTSNWAEATVTWNTQPSVTTLHKVTLAASTSNTQSYPNINVTALVQDMINNPATSFGFRLKMKTEDEPRKLLFASSDNVNPALRPKLVVTYTHLFNSPETAKSEQVKSLLQSQTVVPVIELIPNPAKEKATLNIFSEKNDAVQLNVFNIIGKQVFHQTISLTEGNNEIKLQTDTWEKGIYLFLVKTSETVVTKKLIVE